MCSKLSPMRAHPAHSAHPAHTMSLLDNTGGYITDIVCYELFEQKMK